MPSRFWKASGNALLPSRNTFAVSGAAFTPASLSGINVWLENDPTTVLNAGVTAATDLQTVYKWTGKSGGHSVDDGGNGFTFQPIWHANSGTQGWLDYDATNDYLLSTATFGQTDASGNYYLFVSGYFNSVASNAQNLSLGDVNGQSAFIRVLAGGTVQAVAGDNVYGLHASSGATINAAEWHTIIMQMNATGGTLSVWVDGVKGTDATGLSSMLVATSGTTLYLPKNGGGIGCRIAAAGHGAGLFSGSDVANLHTYLAARHP